jgi:hypothetical protein
MQFQKGHKLAPGGRRAGAGRKPKDAHTLLERILSTVTIEDWQQMVDTTVSMAKAGSKEHLTLLFAYQFGKPVERKEHSGPDGGPIEFRDADEESVLAAADAIKCRRDKLPVL